MCQALNLVCVFIVALASCSSTPYETYNQTHSGLLTPECINHYHRMYVTRRIPPRTYQYYHEFIADPMSDVGISFRIVGGQFVDIEQVPYTVLYGKFCAGSIIAPEWILTAAHCRSIEKYVYAGSTRRSLAKPYRICAHFIHPLYNTSMVSHDYDYQLILLETPIPITPQSRPIAIASPGEIKAGTPVTISGWGHLKPKDHMQDVISKVTVPIMGWEECRSLPLEDYKTITKRMFCAGLRNGTKDSCQGDSGGPAVANHHLLGAVSFGVGCAQPNQPGVYINVPLARDWIRFVTGLPL